MKPNPPARPWIVWRRVQGKKWQQIASTETEAAGWKVFFARHRDDGPGGFDWCVIKTGRKPPK